MIDSTDLKPHGAAASLIKVAASPPHRPH